MKEDKPILIKSIVFKKLMSFPLKLSVCMAIIVSVIILLAEESMLKALLYGFLIGVTVFLFYMIGIIPHMLRLNRQEKVMRFDFNEEMKRRKIRKDRIDANWFIDRGVVLRKGYIKKIEKITYVQSMYSKTSQKTEARIKYLTIDNKIRTMTVGRHISLKLENWMKKK